jgi:hypothetical protein
MYSFRNIKACSHISSWKHRQFIHFDANFRLTLDKRKDRAEGGRSLWADTAFFVDTARYQHYLSTVSGPKQDVSLTFCVPFTFSNLITFRPQIVSTTKQYHRFQEVDTIP